MPIVSKVEKAIEKSEGFRVKFRWPDGSDVKGNKIIRAYKKPERMAKNSFNVSEWTVKRFNNQYPQFAVDILKTDDKKAGGNTKLSTVRERVF